MGQAGTDCWGGGGGGSDCNLSPLFQHRAAGERRCWGLCSRDGPAEALLSITELLHFFMELGTPRKKVLFFTAGFFPSPQYVLIKSNKKKALSDLSWELLENILKTI